MSSSFRFVSFRYSVFELLTKFYTLFQSLLVFGIFNGDMCLSGTFKLTLQFTEDYPNKPPTVRFVSRMFHPNSKYKNFLQFLFVVTMAISWIICTVNAWGLPLCLGVTIMFKLTPSNRKGRQLFKSTFGFWKL